MTAVTIEQLDNAALDVAHIAEVATSTGTTSTDRLGNVKRTVKSAVDSIAAFNSRGAWVTGTVYAVKDLMSNGGTWYACVTAHTASASFATDTASKWRVHQGAMLSDITAQTGAGMMGNAPSGGISATNVQAAINELDAEKVAVAALSATSGSSLAGYIDTGSDAVATTAQAKLRELSASVPSSILPNLGTVTNRNITILGDSISHGAFALNTFMHGWPRVLSRMVNAEIGATSYGFVNFLSLGSGGAATSDIHAVNFFGTAWGSVDSSTDTGASNYPAGMAMRPGDGASYMTISVPSFQSRAVVYYGKRPGSVPFTISVNGSLVSTVTTDFAAGYGVAEVALTDNGYGKCTVTITATAGAASVQADIIGISYLASVNEPVLNNFSNSGRRLRYLSQPLITTLMQESSMLILALGHNDQYDADTDPTYWSDFQTRIGWIKDAAKLYGVKLIVPDFCWGALPSSRARQALRQLAADTRGVYIDLPGEIFNNRETLTTAQRNTYIVSTLAMWTDQSHPGKSGHQWIAETISKRMGLSVTSKNVALRLHDWWMPLELNVTTAAYNYSTGGLVSSFKRNGSEVIVRIYVHKSASLAFPVGSHVIQDVWPTKSEVSVWQGYSGTGVIRSDTGAIVSTLHVSSSGQITLKVTDGAWLNYQQADFSMLAL